MFKKECKRCGKEVSRKDNFCPACGNNLRRQREEEDFGMLGKDDFEDPFRNNMFNIKLPFGFNKIFNSLVKELDRQFRELDKEIGRQWVEERKIKSHTPADKKTSIPEIKKGGISISISSFGNDKPKIRVHSFGNIPEFKKQEKKIKKEFKKEEVSGDTLKRLSKLPHEEATTSVRRLSDKIIYEIEMPEVKSKKDIIITPLENSIEIKAIGKNRAYFKLIPVNLPIREYRFEKGKLILELDARE